MNNRLTDKRVLVTAAVVLVVILVLLSRGCGKSSEPAGPDSSAAQTVTESNAGAAGDSSQAQNVGTETGQGTTAGAGTDSTTADKVDQPDGDGDDKAQEGTILENGGELEVIIPEGEETYGE